MSKKKKKRTPESREPASTETPTEPAAPAKPMRRQPLRKKKPTPIYLIWMAVVAAVIVVGSAANHFLKSPSGGAGTPEPPANSAEAEESLWTGRDYAVPAMSFEAIQAGKRIVDVHEHLQSVKEAPIYLKVMDEMGVGKMCLMGSSWFTITLNEKMGFTRYDENNAELIKIIKAYPGRFEAWPTLNPEDPDKLEKLKALVAQGAQGLKLYIGHGYVTKENKYIFHTMAIDDPRMLPVYEYCQANYVPVVLHVNPFKEKPGFAEELITVLTQYPDMKVCAPHFILSSIQRSRLREYLDTFPNLYSDVSFGDSFVVAGLKRISKNPRAFQEIFRDYPTRFMFASDLVLTDYPSKTEQWIRDQYHAYLDMLSKENYITPVVPGAQLNGLELPNWLLERVLFKNYEDFMASRPKGTQITREIEWDNMNITPLSREPGQFFPPPPKAK